MPIANEETACFVCGRAANLRCSICQRTRYCGAEHQREHWREHRQTCVPPIQTFVEKGHFNSYYDGALLAYSQAETTRYGSDFVQKTMERFARKRMEHIVTLGNENAEAHDNGALKVSEMTENRKRTLVQLHDTLLQKCCLTAAQKEHLKEPMDSLRQHLLDKPLGFVCGYAHAVLEIMQRMMLRDLCATGKATEDGASALAAWTIALQACLERIAPEPVQ